MQIKIFHTDNPEIYWDYFSTFCCRFFSSLALQKIIPQKVHNFLKLIYPLILHHLNHLKKSAVISETGVKQTHLTGLFFLLKKGKLFIGKLLVLQISKIKLPYKPIRNFNWLRFPKHLLQLQYQFWNKAENSVILTISESSFQNFLMRE